MLFSLTTLLSLLLFLPSSLCGRAVFSGGMVDAHNAPIYEAFINQMSPDGQAPYIGIITAGVPDVTTGETTALGIMSVLRILYGVEKMDWLPYHLDNGTTCNSTEWNDMISQMTGLYFNGGNTEPMLDCFFPGGEPTSALQLIKQKYEDGSLAIYGSSAGSLIQQANPVLRIEDSWTALRLYPMYMAQGGFGIFQHGFLDVHFSTRGRQGTLTRLIYELQNETTGHIGFGIDQDTAIIMDDETGFRVVGSAGVYIFDVSTAMNGSKYNTTEGMWDIQNVRVSYLTHGDSYDFATNSITFAVEKNLNLGADIPAVNSSDIFSDGAFTNTSLSLCNSSLSTLVYGNTSEINPQFRVTLTKNISSLCVTGDINGTNFSSYAWISMDIFSPVDC